MAQYENRGGDSKIVSYEITGHAIEVTFADGTIYRWLTESVGEANLKRMHELAREGRGLNAFINSTVKDRYVTRRQ